VAEVVHTGYLDNDYLDDDYLEGTICNVLGMQVGFAYKNIGMEVGEVTTDVYPLGMSVNYTDFPHRVHDVYLNNDYMTTDYLQASQCVFVGMQVVQETPKKVGMQIEQVLYNTCAFRVLCEFASRGTVALDGDNWTATNQETGDFSPNNLNTDIVEEVFRSTSTSVTLTVDTGVAQGVGIDTLAFINHNLTEGAIVQMQGSNDNFASAPNFTTNLEVTSENLFYIATSIPNLVQTNRYWRFVIQDTSNADGYVQIGVIVFGRADIFSKDAVLGCPSEPITAGKTHFKDEISTEGFTNVMNDRTTKRFLRLEFEKILVEGTNQQGTNFNILVDYMDFARTSIKCLVIPTPGCIVDGVDYPDVNKAKRFAVFSKIVRLNEISYISADCDVIYGTVRLEWDESL